RTLAFLLAAALRALAADLSPRGGDGFAFLDERLFDRAGHFHHFIAGDETGHVNDVSVQVAVRTGARHVALEAPEQRRLGPAPVLQIGRPHVVDAPEPALFHELVRERDGRATTIVVPDEGELILPLHAPGGVAHRPGIINRAGQWLFARDVLA